MLPVAGKALEALATSSCCSCHRRRRQTLPAVTPACLGFFFDTSARCRGDSPACSTLRIFTQILADGDGSVWGQGEASLCYHANAMFSDETVSLSETTSSTDREEGGGVPASKETPGVHHFKIPAAFGSLTTENP